MKSSFWRMRLRMMVSSREAERQAFAVRGLLAHEVVDEPLELLRVAERCQVRAKSAARCSIFPAETTI